MQGCIRAIETRNVADEGWSVMREEESRWLKFLCALAETEQDVEKFLALHREINRVLDDKEERLRRAKNSNLRNKN